MKPNGEMPYSTSGHGAWNTQGLTPSDHTFWLLSAVTEYVNATRDRAFLDEVVTYWCEEGRGKCGSATVYEALVAGYLYTKYGVGTGDAGLVRLLHSDWDDFLVLLSADPYSTATRGESTMNTALALAAYPAFAELAEARGDASTAASVRGDVAALGSAMASQWRGDHYNRGYVYSAPDARVELGAESVWMASNGVALTAGNLLDPARTRSLASRVERDNVDPSPVGLASIGSSVFEHGTPGNWYSLTGPTVDGLLAHGERALAWRIFLRQTLANHAVTHPDYAYGIWTGPDMYFTPLDEQAGLGRAGSTWCFPSVCMTDLPFTNMFAHSEPLLASVRMAGFRPDARGMLVDPGAPGNVSWVSPALGLIYGDAVVLGWTRAIADDDVVYRVRLPRATSAAPHASVDGRVVPVAVEAGTAQAGTAAERYAVFTLKLRTGGTTYWVVY